MRAVADKLREIAASLGGSARAQALTPAERSGSARKAALARYAKTEVPGGIPKARSEGVLPIGSVKIDVYVLWDRRRLVSKRAMARALGLKSDGGNAFLKTLSGKTIGSIIPDSLWEKINNPIVFSPLVGDPAHGYEATVLIEVCDALIEGRKPEPPDTITPDHEAAQWFADTQLEFVHSHIANLARCYLALRHPPSHIAAYAADQE